MWPVVSAGHDDDRADQEHLQDYQARRPQRHDRRAVRVNHGRPRPVSNILASDDV